MEKTVVKRDYNGRDFTLEYSDGTILTHTENAGIIGISDDKIKSIPIDLFRYNTVVTTFYQFFYLYY